MCDSACETHRSVLSTKADEAEPLKPGKVWDEHSILLLEGSEPLSDKLVSDIYDEVKKVCPSAALSPPPSLCQLALRRALERVEALSGRPGFRVRQ